MVIKMVNKIDKEPTERQRKVLKAIKKYTSMGSGLVLYKGVGWDWRMAKYALEKLNARRDEYKSNRSGDMQKS